VKLIRVIDGEAWVHEQPALQPIVGRGMDQLVLDAKDFRDLASLKPDELYQWLRQLQTRFPDAQEKGV
jgi:hypothetical protein